ncbi:MAG: hypothetical protein ABI700_14500, partial [Chloroflexota bacterium]
MKRFSLCLLFLLALPVMAQNTPRQEPLSGDPGRKVQILMQLIKSSVEPAPYIQTIHWLTFTIGREQM